MAKAVKTKSKNKNKNVNKGKIFLANPAKPKCPSLDDEELEYLERILTETINNNKLTPRSFATTQNICIGLESSLRSINNRTAGCVFLSSNIKPRYLLGLIARNVEVKDRTVPTYAEKQLEDFTQRIFGVKALALVLPKNSSSFSVELAKWIKSHQRKTARLKRKSSVAGENPKRKIIEPTSPPCEQLKVLSIPTEPVEKKQEEKQEVKQWGSSYVSFSNDANRSMEIDEANAENDEEILVNTLKQMASKVKQSTEKPNLVSSHASNEQEVKRTFGMEITSDDDEFFGSYAPLTVHKICPNSERKPRKKRKKKENKKIKSK